jgi:hypothetical protein
MTTNHIEQQKSRGNASEEPSHCTASSRHSRCPSLSDVTIHQRVVSIANSKADGFSKTALKSDRINPRYVCVRHGQRPATRGVPRRRSCTSPTSRFNFNMHPEIRTGAWSPDESQVTLMVISVSWSRFGRRLRRARLAISRWPRRWPALAQRSRERLWLEARGGSTLLEDSPSARRACRIDNSSKGPL